MKYDAYCKGWKKNPFATWIVPRYVYTDADGYDYGVKYPEYLSITGNMSVGLPAIDDNPFTDFLIVWPTAVNPEDSEIVERCQDTINDLLNRAKKMWNLK